MKRKALLWIDAVYAVTLLPLWGVSLGTILALGGYWLLFRILWSRLLGGDPNSVEHANRFTASILLLLFSWLLMIVILFYFGL